MLTIKQSERLEDRSPLNSGPLPLFNHDTPIWTKIPTSEENNAAIDPNEVARAGVPRGRAGQAQDIANGVLFLASDASSYITSAELVIDGA